MSSQLQNVIGTEFQYHAIASGNCQAFVQYCDYFYNPTFSVIARLSGIRDSDILSLLTESVFLHLWGSRDDFLNYNSGWLFRTVIQVTTRYLKEHGQHQRAQKIMDVIDPERLFQAIEKHKNDSHETGNP